MPSINNPKSIIVKQQNINDCYKIEKPIVTIKKPIFSSKNKWLHPDDDLGELERGRA